MEVVECIIWSFLAVVLISFLIAFGIQFFIHNQEDHEIEIDRKIAEINRLRR